MEVRQMLEQQIPEAEAEAVQTTVFLAQEAAVS
jgi:hypothetical protein